MLPGGRVDDNGPPLAGRFDPPHSEPVALQPPADLRGAEVDVQATGFEFVHMVVIQAIDFVITDSTGSPSESVESKT